MHVYFFYFRKHLTLKIIYLINPFLHIYSFYLTEEKSFRKTLWKKVKLLKMSNFTFFHIVFYAIYILKFCNSHILVVACSFFALGTVAKWCIREWVMVKSDLRRIIVGTVYFSYPRKTNVFGGILESACLSVHVSVCVQNTSFCQRAGGGIKSHLVTALVFSGL